MNEITSEIIAAAITVHRELGNGCLENPYHLCLEEEIRYRGLRVKSEVPVPLRYRSLHIELAFRLDLIVEDAVVIEVKAVDSITPALRAQLGTYLRLANKDVGLLINFRERYLRDGIVRIVA